MRGARAVVAAGLLLGGCAGPLKSTLPAPPPPGARVGAPAPVWDPVEAQARLGELRGELERRIASREWTVPVQLTQSADGALHVRLGADESFVAGGAVLQPAALAVYAEIAAAIAARPAVVTHVVVHGDAGGTDPTTDLTARRAASVQHYLARRGIPETRVRAEGRGGAEPLPDAATDPAVNRRVELVLRPVVAGREREAWMPPAPLAGCDPCETPEQHEAHGGRRSP